MTTTTTAAGAHHRARVMLASPGGVALLADAADGRGGRGGRHRRQSREPALAALPALQSHGAPREARLAALSRLRPPVPPQRSPALARRSEEIRGVDSPRTEQAAQLAQSRGLDLPYALAAEIQALADCLQRLRLLAFQPEAPAQHRALVGGEIVQHGDEVGARVEEPREDGGGIGRGIGDDVAQPLSL